MPKIRKDLLVAVAVVVVLSFIAGAVTAAIPQKINYQGRLTDSGTGLPLPGSHSAVFKIYDDSTDGVLLWSETTSVSADTNGVFAVLLGSVNPIDLDFDGPTYLQVEIGGETLTPRRELVSSPYAFNAMNSESLDGLPAGDYATTGALGGIGTINDPSNPVDWSQLKNVPAGFADGSDDGAGTGDGHSLDAADGDPVDVVYVDNTGEVGIGTTTPEEKLHVSGDIRLDSSGDIAFGDDNTRVYHSTDDLRLTSEDDIYLNPDDDIYIGVDGGSTWAHFDAGNKRLGVGLQNPSQEIQAHASGGVACYMGVTNATTGTTDDDGLMMGINGSGDAFIYNQESGRDFSLGTNDTRRLFLNDNGNGAIGNNTSPDQKLEVDGNILADTLFLGEGSIDGYLELNSDIASEPIFTAGRDLSYGGEFWCYDEAGNKTGGMEADHDGEGGYVVVYRDESYAGFIVDGDYNNWGNGSAVYVLGSSQSAEFNMHFPGDESIQLPNDAISAPEIEDEPGVVAANRNGPYLDLQTDPINLESRTITSPGPGYCLVIGSCEVRIIHTNGSSSSAIFGVTTTYETLPTDQDFSLSIPWNNPSGTYYMPVTVHCIIETPGGGDTFYLVGEESQGDYAVYEAQLSVIYFPTAYGTVSPPDPGTATAAEDQTGTRLPMTEADVEAERQESEAFNRARVEEELAAMRARLEALEQVVQEQQ
jgi:hypothetical protein